MLAEKCIYFATSCWASAELLTRGFCPHTGRIAVTWCNLASKSYILALCCILGLVSDTGNLTFPSAPSSTPSRPTISFRLMAPADCLPPSNFRSLGRTSQEEMLVYFPKCDTHCVKQHSHPVNDGFAAFLWGASVCSGSLSHTACSVCEFQ